MSLFKRIKCSFCCKENNGGYKEKEFECIVVCQSSSVAFVIYKMRLQFHIDKKVLRKAFLDYKNIETDVVYIDFKDENVVPVKYKIKIDIMKRKANFNIINTNSFIGIINEDLEKILDIK